MARRKDSPQKAAMREMMRDYLKNNDISIKNGTDVNSIMRDMMSVLLEGALNEELDEELGYSKYTVRSIFTLNAAVCAFQAELVYTIGHPQTDRRCRSDPAAKKVNMAVQKAEDMTLSKGFRKSHYCRFLSV